MNTQTTIDYKVVTSGYNDYVSFCLGDTEIVQIKTKASECAWISQELNTVITGFNSYAEAISEIKKLRGMEAWLGDRQMKELFQKTIYSILDKYEKQVKSNFQ